MSDQHLLFSHRVPPQGKQSVGNRTENVKRFFLCSTLIQRKNCVSILVSLGTLSTKNDMTNISRRISQRKWNWLRIFSRCTKNTFSKFKSNLANRSVKKSLLHMFLCKLCDKHSSAVYEYKPEIFRKAKTKECNISFWFPSDENVLSSRSEDILLIFEQCKIFVT